MLVLTGANDPKVFGKIDQIQSDGVRMVGFVPDTDLRTLYEHALALVFPSFYEGFGLPPLEAMTCGCPVIISEQPALIEVCGDAALRCRADDTDRSCGTCRRCMPTPDCARGWRRPAKSAHAASPGTRPRALCSIIAWRSTPSGRPDMKRRLISIPFFLLRTTTAGAALLTGLLQTYVFAHVLSPQRFSIFILVAAFGYSLWLIDFGIVKILFVRLRARFLAGDRSDAVAGHATAVVLFYFVLVTTGALLCFIFMATQTAASLREAAEFGLFFWFVALNLVWFALRNISIAVDEYVLFEALETVRRAGYFIGLAAVLFGLPLLVMLIALNALWAVVVTACVRRMIARGALRPHIGGFVADFVVVLPRQQGPARAQRHLCGERNLCWQLSLSDRADAVRPRRAAHHPRHHLQGVPRRRHHFRRGLRYSGAAPDQRAGRARRADAGARDADGGRAVQHSGGHRLPHPLSSAPTNCSPSCSATRRPCRRRPRRS